MCEGVVSDTTLEGGSVVWVVAGVDGGSYEWRWRLYLTEEGNLRPIPKRFTLFSYVVIERKVLTEEELATELAWEQCAEK